MLQVSNSLAEVTFKGTLEEINDVVGKIGNPELAREHNYPKVQMVQIIRQKTGFSLLDCKIIAEDLIELIKSCN